MEAYNFAEIRTPIFEETYLFARSIGGETDIVAKEMFSFEDRASGRLAELKDIIALRTSNSSAGLDAFITEATEFIELATESSRRGDIPPIDPERIEALRSNVAGLEKAAQQRPVDRGIVQMLSNGIKGVVYIT